MILRRQGAPHGVGGADLFEFTKAPDVVIARKRVLITGAGGSIGSALAHAVAAHGPEALALVDSSEQALYSVDREVAAQHSATLADVCDVTAMEEAFARHRPQIVFHAAAFKHVPLMEAHPIAAVRNNTVGSFTLARIAVRHGAEQIVIVSTDKAVEPASIMGASKRIAELVALALASSATKIKAVRLGNVYGSQGSVVPLFEEQIARGGPVTITHSDATRYFLSLDEAAEYLLLALANEFSSGILVPELAEPVRVEEIARELIAKSGSGAEISYIGLRPGEKLHEKLLAEDESFAGGAAGSLRKIRSAGISADEAERAIRVLQSAIAARDVGQLLGVVMRLVPSYRPSEMMLAQQAAAGCRG